MKWALKKAKLNEEKKLFNESRNSTQSAEHEAHTHTKQLKYATSALSLLERQRYRLRITQDINPSQLEVGRYEGKYRRALSYEQQHKIHIVNMCAWLWILSTKYKM